MFKKLNLLDFPSSKSQVIYLFSLTLGFVSLALSNLTDKASEQHFIYLAYAFLKGKLFFSDFLPPHATDTTLYQGHYFWPAGPLPAILLMPGVYFFGFSIHQGYLIFILHLINFWLLYKIAHKLTSSTETSLWLSFGYIFSTVYLYIAILPWSWFLSQILVTTFLLLAIYEFLNQKRWLLIGICLAAAILTRANVALAIVFFVAGISLERISTKFKLRQLLLLLLPFFIAFGVLFLYNYLRFGNIFERGDSFTSLATDETTKNRLYGVWSLIHMPTNFYYLFLKSPDPIFYPGTKILAFPYLKPDPWGMSIFLTSPIFLWIFKTPFNQPLVRFASLTVLLILFFNLGWFSIGFQQYGYRYALDFQPFLYLMLCLVFKNGISKLFKTVAIVSFVINLLYIPLTFMRFN